VDWKPAKVSYENGSIVRHYEVPTFSLDESKIAEVMLAAVESGEARFTLPMSKNAPKIPDEMLDRITEVMAEFSTSFNETQANRSSNIRLACKALNGQIVMPGEELGYNTVVGKRTAENGYKEAPVFKNGKKVLDNGGGVCQVSTTMFNAALFADLEIVKRTNHSRPVPYVPMGRDATVDYSSGVDLVVKNPYDFPIAINSEVKGNTVTFRILGQKDESKTIAIITTGHTYWANAVRYVDDPAAPVGKEVVVDSGAGGGTCQTWRVVKRNGVEVKRENIGKSRYPGAAKIIARNPTVPPPTVGPDGMPVVNPQKKDEAPNGEPKPTESTTTNGSGGGH
jgi:vancomycin resistance protein YoaR